MVLRTQPIADSQIREVSICGWPWVNGYDSVALGDSHIIPNYLVHVSYELGKILGGEWSWLSAEPRPYNKRSPFRQVPFICITTRHTDFLPWTTANYAILCPWPMAIAIVCTLLRSHRGSVDKESFPRFTSVQAHYRKWLTKGEESPFITDLAFSFRAYDFPHKSSITRVSHNASKPSHRRSELRMPQRRSDICKPLTNIHHILLIYPRFKDVTHKNIGSNTTSRLHLSLKRMFMLYSTVTSLDSFSSPIVSNMEEPPNMDVEREMLVERWWVGGLGFSR